MKQLLSVFILALLAACATTGPSVDKAKMAEGYYMKGYSYFQDDKIELASVEFNRSIQTDARYKQSYYMLGIVSDRRSQYRDAIGYYKKAVSLDPQYSEAYNAMGADYVYLKKWDEALKAFKRALNNKLYATPHIPLVNIGRMYMVQKDYPRAVQAFREAKQYANLDFVVYELGTALYEDGRIKEAISEFREGIRIAPQNANFRYSLGIALLKDGNKNGAVMEFRKTAELAPGSDIALKANDYIKTLR